MELKQITREDWIKALRSGEYEQGIGVMHNTFHNAYCCLGVACKLAGVREEWLSGVQTSSFEFLGADAAKQMYQMLGLHIQAEDEDDIDISTDYNATHVLASLNDTGHSFEEIANLLEKST